MPALMLRFAARPNLSMPWPVRVDASGKVTHGRPDARQLLGFQKYKHVQRMDLSLDDAIGTLPESAAVGMYPIYSGETDSGQGIFVVLDKVVAVDVIEVHA